MISVREEQRGDLSTIRLVNELAFGRPDEANLADRLRENCPYMLSLVASLDGKTLGHALFSPVMIEGDEWTIEGMGLPPIAVLPQFNDVESAPPLFKAGS